MIRLLNLAEDVVAKEVLAVQVPAYRVEAALIGFDDIPPLKDTVQSLQASEETFYGYRVDGRLVGVIAVEAEQQEGEPVLTISRLTVHPDSSRRGIGKALLQHAEQLAVSAAKPFAALTVATGAANEPAVQLYVRYGFQKRDVLEVAPGLLMQFFHKALR